jgi:hypothetical protein
VRVLRRGQLESAYSPIPEEKSEESSSPCFAFVDHFEQFTLSIYILIICHDDLGFFSIPSFL